MRYSVLAAVCLTSCATAPTAAPPSGAYLFAWSLDIGARKSDFLAVIDADESSPTYGKVVASAPAGAARTGAHHTEHEMPAGGVLMANGYRAGTTFIFDLRAPLAPRLAGSFAAAGEYMHPHSFVRLPNNNVLATFQMRGHGNAEPGGLVELGPDGAVLRASPAADPSVEPFIRPYSLAVVPKLDRVVTSSADMDASAISRAIQVWRLSDLKLLKTIRLPAGPRGTENGDPAEPRLLADGETVLVASFYCGLFRVTGLATSSPSAELVHSFPGQRQCFLPVVSGKYWVQTDQSLPGLISLDVSNPARPVEVSRLTLAPKQLPHWISLAPDGERIAVTGYGDLQHRLLMARIDRTTGKLRLVTSFRTPGAAEPGISFIGPSWPHGETGPAVPHGVVFSR